MGFELLALVCAALFAGASIYVSVVEHPARLLCGPAVALAQWRPSYKRAAAMQSALAAVGVLSAIVAYARGRGLAVLVGGLVLATVVPFTLLVIMPTNRQLLDPARTAETPETSALLDRWGRLHAVRAVASLLAVAILAAHLRGYLG